MEQIINNLVISINSIGHGFCNYTGNMFVQSSVLIVLLLIIDFLLRRHVRAVFRYFLWMLVFIKLILPPTLSLQTGIGYWCGGILPAERFASKPISNMSYAEPAKPVIPKDFVISTELADVQPSRSFPEATVPIASTASSLLPATWQGIVFLTWLVGVLVFSVLLIQRMFFVRALLLQSKHAKGRLLDTLNQCRQQVGIHRSIELKLSNHIQSPAVCGLFRPAILMPTSLLEKLSRDKLRAVLIHELAHIKRGDLWVNFIQTVLQIIYFYNPLIWLANTMVRRTREQAVDEMVLVALGNEAKSYSNTLIDIAEMVFWKANLSLRLIGVAESKNALHRRIKHILTRPIPKSAKLGFLGLLVVIILAAILLPMARAVNEVNPSGSQFVVAWWMAAVEEPVANRLISMSEPLLTNSKIYHAYKINGDELIKLIAHNQNSEDVVFVSRALRWLSPTGKYKRASSWADTDNLKHPVFVGYGTVAGGPYKMNISKNEVLLELEYERVYCHLNSGSSVEGSIFFEGRLKPDQTLAFVSKMPEKDNSRPWHIVFYQVVEVSNDQISFVRGIQNASEWIQLETKPESSSPFMAVLPNGVTVELVGMGKEPWQNDQEWWRPDGTKIVKPKFKAHCTPWPTDPNKLQFECAALFKFSNHTGKSISVPEVKFSNKLLHSGSVSTISDDGTQVTYITSVPCMGMIPNKADIYLAIGANPFKKAITPSREFNEKMHEVYTLEDNSLVIRHPLRIDYYLGTPAVDLTCPKNDIEFRVIAELKNGQTEQWGGGSVGKEVQFFVATPRRENIKVEDIKQLTIEYRPYEWITFKNVSLQPGLKTDVQVEVEKPTGEKGKAVEGIDITPVDFDIRLDQERGVCDLAVSIKNESSITIPKFKMKFYRGDISDNLDEAGNTHSGWHEAGPIEPGKRWNESTRDFNLPDGQYEFNVFLDFDNSISEIDENNNRAVLQVRIENGQIVEKSVTRPSMLKDLKPDVQVEVEREATTPQKTTDSLPNIFIMEPSKSTFSIFNEVVSLSQNWVWNKTGRQHNKKFYDEIFDGTHNRTSDDILVLVFSLDRKDRIPTKYEDLLPKPWPQIEAELKQGRTMELLGKARGLNVILLAAPKIDQLKKVIAESKFLNNPKSFIKTNGKGCDVGIEDFKIDFDPDRMVYNAVASIHNYGKVASPKFIVNFYCGDPGQVKPMTHGAGPIKPDGVWNECSMPFGLKEGTNEITVVLDPANLVEETDETNNRALMTIVIKNGEIIEKSVKRVGVPEK